MNNKSITTTVLVLLSCVVLLACALKGGHIHIPALRGREFVMAASSFFALLAIHLIDKA